jgi:nucleotide-binding universal stress UspA family protein
MATVVLGYVPKPEGEAALAASIAEAVRREADLVVVNSHRAHRGDAEAHDRLQAELEEVRARVEKAGVAVDVRHPDTGLEASEDLLSIAEEVGAELVVIGLRRRTPVGKLILGSNAQRILLDAPCPVLAVKSG